MLKKMGEYFDSRIDSYEHHQLTCIDSACEFYTFTAKCLPHTNNACVLDLGCGTGLELNYYFKIVPTAKITGIDLAPGMLNVLRDKFKNKSLKLILGSYFDIFFGENKFDAVVSVESLHHFEKEKKIPLYKKIYKALKDGGYFILTDYFALSDTAEKFYYEEFVRLKKEQDIKSDEIYHYDIPLTVEHEIQALSSGGFSSVKILNNWGATYTLKAEI